MRRSRFGLVAASAVLVGTVPIVGQAVRYVDVAAEGGLTHVFPNGGDDAKEWILETTGSGAAFLDFNLGRPPRCLSGVRRRRNEPALQEPRESALRGRH